MYSKPITKNVDMVRGQGVSPTLSQPVAVFVMLLEGLLGRGFFPIRQQVNRLFAYRLQGLLREKRLMPRYHCIR